MGNIISNIVLISYGDRLALYTNVKSLCCASETILILYVNSTSIKTKLCQKPTDLPKLVK